MFWFMIISDTHIGAYGSQDSDYLEWAVTEARSVISPLFIINAGDLTDSTNGGIIPNGPYQEEWDEYRNILLGANIDAGFYYDIPGNHDHYNDATFSFYLTNSIQGSATGSTQHSWIRQFPYGKYHFMGVCTAGNDGAPFSIWPWDNFGDHAGLDEDELAFIETKLDEHSDASLTIIFGHHPFEAGYSGLTDTGFTYGLDPFLDLLDCYNVSTYGFGHTHDYNEDFYHDHLSTGVFYLNVASLGKSDQNHYAVMAIDGNGMSVKPGQKGQWPLVIITAPTDQCLGECPNPFAYNVPMAPAIPIRALVFDRQEIKSVKFHVDGNPVWYDMEQTPGTPFWVGHWDSSKLSGGLHSIEVEADGTGVAADEITTYVDEEACFGDSDQDGDVDGKDLSAFINDFSDKTLKTFAVFLGRPNCK